jgi:hypothetical protein
VRRVLERALGFAVLLATGWARADPGAPGAAPPDAAHTARLTYVRGSGAEVCPDEEALRGAVARRLGYDPFRSDAPRSVRASVRVAGGGLHGEVQLGDASGAVMGARHLSAAGDDCDELVAAMALAISIAIDPNSLSSAPPPPPPAAPAPPPGSLAPPFSARTAPPAGAPDLTAPPLPAPLPPPSPPRAPRAEAPAGWLGLGGVVAAGTAPRISGGVAVQAGLRWGRLSAALEGRADPPASTSAQGRRVSATVLTVGVVPCFHVRVAAVCAVGSAGVLHGAGAGVARPKSETTPYGAMGPRLGVAIPLVPRLSAEVHGDIAFTLTPTTLELDGRGVWTTPAAAAAFGGGLLVHFP